MAKTFAFTNGDVKLANKVSTAVDYTLTDADKTNCFVCTASAASKSVILGLADGESMFVVNNGGTNAFTVKNLKDDTGTSLAAGKVALVIASTTADGTLIYVLN